MVVGLMRTMRKLMQEYGLLDRERMSRLKPEDMLNKTDMVFLYSLVWSVGGSVDESSRALFDNYLKKMIKEPIKCLTKKDRLVRFEKNAAPPDVGKTVQVYDYFVDGVEWKWRKWQDQLDLAEKPITEDSYQKIVVETAESLRLTRLLELAVGMVGGAGGALLQ